MSKLRIFFLASLFLTEQGFANYQAKVLTILEKKCAACHAVPEKKQIRQAVEERRMPPAEYVLLHPEHQLTDAERAMIIQWTTSNEG